MKSFSSLSYLTVITTLLISSCNLRRESGEYYRKVLLDGRYSIIGEYPLTPEMGRKGESYYFLYDKGGKLIRVEHLLGGKLKGSSFFGNDVAVLEIRHFETYEKRAYFDVNGIPVKDRNGVLSIGIFFDENTNPVYRLNYDKYGEFTEDVYGVAQYSWSLAGEGRIVKEAFYNFSGKRVTIDDGSFEIRFKYDKDGNMIERSFFDSAGNLTENEDGVAVMRQKFDDKGDIIEIRYFGEDNKLKELDNGVAIIHQKFDEYGNIIEIRYLGKNEGFKENNMGVAIIRDRFDTYGNIVERKYYDISDELTEGKFYGFAIMQWEYDKDGRVVEARFLDADGNLKNAINEEAAILRMKYDEEGNLVQVLHFDKEGELVQDSTISVP